MNKHIDLRFLKKYRPYLTKQQIDTIRGQILSGNKDGAIKGLKKILKRQGVEYIGK